MTTTASAMPPTLRSPSSPRRDTRSEGLPQRTQSLATRNASQPRSTSTQSTRQPLANVARRDQEQATFSNDSSAKASMDAARAAMQPLRTPAPTRLSDVHSPTTASTNGGDISSRQNANQGPRRRTEIKAQTGTWQLQKTIGQGSMGKVKLARHIDNGEQCAIKIIPRQSTDEHRTQADRDRADHSKEVRTAREAAIVTLLNHPYICGMRDVVRTNYHWYMLFEYVNGGQMLDYIISHGRLKEKQARKFGRQIASALDYCHRNSIVHRDLKIENILISKEGNIKIIDFGLSNLFSPKSLLKTFCGSLYFAAPELLQAKAYQGPEVDIWSFGIVLYVLVCGKVPFDDQSMPQLHAKIKKGIVEYPPWLSTECRHLISTMLVTDPKARAKLPDIIAHPWMNKGCPGPQENYLPHREPLQLPLDKKVIDKMTGFDFGSAEYITTQLEAVIRSEEYQKAVQQAALKAQPSANDADRKKSGMFDFYRTRKPSTNKEALSAASAESVNTAEDPVNAYHPLISIYYLVREKQEREKVEVNPGALAMPQSPGEKPLQLPDLPAPMPAMTNTAAYEMPGEQPTGGRARPRARTNGEEEMKELAAKASPPPLTPSKQAETPVKKESAAAGLLRRFSTRRGRNTETREKPVLQSPAPTVEISEPESSLSTPNKRLSIRKTRERDAPPSAFTKYASNHPELLAPPLTEAPEPSPQPKSRGLSLGRSTSVNSSDIMRRFSRRGTSESRVPQLASQRESLEQTRSHERDGTTDSMPLTQNEREATSRTKSTGSAPRESMQARRALREQPQHGDVDLPEETDQDLADYAAADSHGEGLKPVYLKGLFSVSTTSSKPLSFMRADIIRVLRQLGIEYREIKGGFTCRRMPSVDIRKPVDSPQQELQPRASMAIHKRRISFAGLRGGDKDKEDLTPSTPRTPRRPIMENGSTNSEESLEEGHNRRHDTTSTPRLAAGETTTHVQNDMNQGTELVFEILVVKVPLLSLHGLQFKKVDGNTWQYKQMATTILGELKL